MTANAAGMTADQEDEQIGAERHERQDDPEEQRRQRT